MASRTIIDITNFIFISDDLKPCDIIFLPGSSRWEISEKAAQLFTAGFAKHVLPAGKYSSRLGCFASENVTSEKYKGNYSTDSEYCASILQYNGVPDKAIIRESESLNTMENAENSANLLTSRAIKITSAILCCQAFHARRALMSYMRYFPSVQFYVAAVNTQGITRDNWYEDREKYHKVLKELEKCGKYFADCYNGNGYKV